jgi:hypothetical protein
MKKLVRRPSPAMVVALIALFSSLGGVSYAVATGSIDSREIRNNSVRGKDVRNGTLSSRDLGDSGRPVRKFGPVGIALGGQAALISHPPFTILGQCQAAGPQTRLRLILVTTEGASAFGSAANNEGDVGPATPEARRIIRNTSALATATSHSESANDGFSALAPSGKALTGRVHSAVNGVARTCRAYGDYTRIR